MVSRVPVLPTIVFVSAAESFAAVIFVPEHLPQNPFVWALVRFIGLNIFLYLVYLIEIWPRILSPLRHLPRPKVCEEHARPGVQAVNHHLRERTHFLVMVLPSSIDRPGETFSDGSRRCQTMGLSISEASSIRTDCLSRIQKLLPRSSYLIRTTLKSHQSRGASYAAYLAMGSSLSRAMFTGFSARMSCQCSAFATSKSYIP